MDDDSELLRRYAQDRDEAAFAELVRRRIGLVYHTALRRLNGDFAQAEEVAQDVFATLARDAEKLQERQLLGGWLYVATRHAAANAQRGENRRRAREQEAMSMKQTDDGPEIATAWEQLRPALDEVLDELNDPERELILTRYFEGRSYGRIAAGLRISEDAARMRTERALERARVLFARRGVTSTAAVMAGAFACQSALAAPPGLAGAVAASAVASVGATSASVLTFMATNKMMVVTTSILALAAGGVATYEFARARRLEGQVVQLRVEKTGDESRVREAERAARTDAEAARRALERLAEMEGRHAGQGAGRQAAAESQAMPTAMASRPAPVPNRQAYFANPDYIRLQLKISELGLGLQYGVMYRRLGWSQDKIREFEALMLTQQRDLFTVMGAAAIAGAPMDDPAVQSSFKDPSFQNTYAKLQALFGQDFPTYKEYSEANRGMSRSTVTNLAGSLYGVGDPLSLTQAESLSRLIANKTPKNPARVSGMTTASEPDWNAVFTEAVAFLSPSQLSALRATAERSALLREVGALEQKINAQQADSPSGG